MAATIFTAVDTAPRIIRMEINGVINPFPIPFCTISSVGTLVPAISGLVETVIIPRQTIVIISALMIKNGNEPDAFLYHKQPYPCSFDCIARFFEYFGVLDKYRNVCQLERSVKECGVKCLSEWLCGCCHLLCGCTDGRPSVNDIRNVYNQKPGNDADGKHGGYPAHQIGAENGNDKDKNADDQGTQQIRKSCQCT